MVHELGLALAEMLESLLNRVLARDPETLARLGALQGRVVAVEFDGVSISGEPLRLYLLPHAGGIQILTRYHGSADTVLSGTPLALATMRGEAGATRRLFSGEVRIDGDIELGQRFKRILDGLDIDGEEWLAGYVGDGVAHHSGRALRGARQWLQASAATLGQDLSEYLRYEAALLVDRPETEDFFDAVDRLRSDVDRLTARVARLTRRLAGESTPEAEPVTEPDIESGAGTNENGTHTGADANDGADNGAAHGERRS